MNPNKLKVLVLFAGTRSIEKAFQQRGHETFSIDWDEQFTGIDWHVDVNSIKPRQIIKKFGKPDVIWLSPDCSSYSIAAISHHRRQNAVTGELEPVSDAAKLSDETVKNALKLVEKLNPVVYFIENPRGGFRKMSFIQHLHRHTVTYCQYGDIRMKPTDIFSNHPHLGFKPMCKNGDACHEPAPRGSKTGTQGLAGAIERGMIPHNLGLHVARFSEDIVANRVKWAQQNES